MTEWHARFERDAAFRQAVEDAYEGRQGVADAVWWLDHPEADAPSGEPSPRHRLAALQRTAFARPAPGDEAEAAAAAALAELDALTSGLEVDRSEAQRAVDDALSVLDARPSARRRTAVLAGALIAAACISGAVAFAATPALISGFADAAGADAAGGGAADGSGASAGTGTPAGTGDTGSADDNGDNAAESRADGAGTPAGSGADGGSSYSATGGSYDDALGPLPTAAPYPNFPPGIGADSYATIFTHPQVESDLPPSPGLEGLVTSTFRALSLGQNTSGAAYAAVNESFQICLVVYGNPTDSGYTCDEATRVASRGLQVSLSTRDRTDPASGVVTPGVSLSARWMPDGEFILDQSLPYDRD